MYNTENLINILSCCSNINSINLIKDNSKLEYIYKNLFKLLNNSNSNNDLIYKLWIDHLNNCIKDLEHAIENCEKFLENIHDDNSITKYTNIQIETLYNLSIMKKYNLI